MLPSDYWDDKMQQLSLVEKPKEKISNEVCILCSEAAVLSVLLASKNMGADTVTTLKYANSGDISRDKSRVVGYGALVVAKKNSKEIKEEGMALFDPKILNEQDKKELLSIQRFCSLW